MTKDFLAILVEDFGIELMKFLADALPIVILLYASATVFTNSMAKGWILEQSGDRLGKDRRFVSDEDFLAIFEIQSLRTDRSRDNRFAHR